jgi:hypothetical protein
MPWMRKKGSRPSRQFILNNTTELYYTTTGEAKNHIPIIKPRNHIENQYHCPNNEQNSDNITKKPATLY